MVVRNKASIVYLEFIDNRKRLIILDSAQSYVSKYVINPVLDSESP